VFVRLETVHNVYKYSQAWCMRLLWICRLSVDVLCANFTAHMKPLVCSVQLQPCMVYFLPFQKKVTSLLNC